MTEILRAELRGSKEAAAFGKLEQVLEEDSKPNADIEYMLSLVRALGDVAGATGCGRSSATRTQYSSPAGTRSATSI